MKRLRSTRDRAEATIWQHCLDSAVDLWETRHRIAGDVVDAMATILSLVMLAMFPVTLPVVGYLRRREARREIADSEEHQRCQAVVDEGE